MTFIDLNLNATYDSDEDDILKEFYIPVLSNARRYDRLAGYFSSASLATSAKGMAQFIRNGGTMRLVTSMQISKDDHQAIITGITKPDEVISRMLKDELDVVDSMQKNHVDALAWMIAAKKLEIKIAVPLEAGTDSFYTGSIAKNSIYHQKIGVLYDDRNNVISFSGSVNETSKAWNENIEEFKVFRSWVPGQDIYGASDAKKFEKFWYGNSNNTKIFDLPTAIRDHLIQNAPETESEAINKIGGLQNFHMRDYQTEAMNRWFENNKRGIFEMATGSGKTHVAISCIKKLLNSPDAGRNLVVVACPFIHLVTQWVNQLDAWGISTNEAYGSSDSWQKDLNNRVLHLNSGILPSLVIVTTHNTFSSKKFIDMIKICRVNSFIVADEVHKIGAEKNSDGMLDIYNHRLGLSATPERYFDEEGTKNILDFFGGVVYKFGLDEAIKRGYLTRYRLFPHVVYMTDDETHNYHHYSRLIAIESNKKIPDQNLILKLTIKRSDIIKTARNKIDEFQKILTKVEKLDHCLVYCSGEQLEDAASILHDMGIIFHRFTFRENNKERKKLLDEFDKGDKNVLLAIKCLDEGVDVPSTKTAIILASSRNPIEFIQRRGRILRPHAGKEYAIIHDLIVLPSSLPMDEIHTDSEKTIIKNELKRLVEFAKSSENSQYSIDLMQTFMNRYNL